jgi:hypothetical protein
MLLFSERETRQCFFSDRHVSDEELQETSIPNEAQY